MLDTFRYNKHDADCLFPLLALVVVMYGIAIFVVHTHQ